MKSYFFYLNLAKKERKFSNISNVPLIWLLYTGLCMGSASAQLVAKTETTQASPIKIEATEFLEWNKKDGIYIAKGNAFVEQGNASIKAEQVVAKYANENENRNITRVIATGNVIYQEGKNTAKGSKLDYDLTTRRYILTGEKAIVSGPRGMLSANKSITYDTKNVRKRVMIAIGKAHYKNSQGRSIFGDKLVALIGPDGALSAIDAYNNTKVVTANGTVATADKLNYVASTSLANLDGNVKVVDEKGNLMAGAKAEINFDKEISKMLSSPNGKRVSGTLTP